MRSGGRSRSGRSRPDPVRSSSSRRRSATAQQCAAPRRSRYAACSTRRGRRNAAEARSDGNAPASVPAEPGVGRRWRSDTVECGADACLNRCAGRSSVPRGRHGEHQRRVRSEEVHDCASGQRTGRGAQVGAARPEARNPRRRPQTSASCCPTRSRRSGGRRRIVRRSSRRSRRPTSRTSSTTPTVTPRSSGRRPTSASRTVPRSSSSSRSTQARRSRSRGRPSPSMRR